VVPPGLVDAHVHVNDPRRAHWEGFRTATRAAAAGGITTLIDMPLNSSPVTTRLTALKAKQAARAYRDYLGSRPRQWENDAIDLLIALCREFESPIHIVHLSSTDRLDELVAARAEGLPLTVETSVRTTSR
jgi:dihydroorotase-like cyclic amidohydrolase